MVLEALLGFQTTLREAPRASLSNRPCPGSCSGRPFALHLVRLGVVLSLLERPFALRYAIADPSGGRLVPVWWARQLPGQLPGQTFQTDLVQGAVRRGLLSFTCLAARGLSNRSVRM